MTRVTVAMLSAVVAGLILVPGSVSAKAAMITVSDSLGDIAVNYDYTAYEPRIIWGDNTQISEAGYFDMTLFWFGLKGTSYTFGMELAADLPQEGDPLPSSVGLVQYMLWLDKDSWNWYEDDLTLFMVVLQYDGASYSAALLDYPSHEVIMPLPFTVNGAMFEVEFSADSIDNTPAFWLFPSVLAYYGQGASYWWTDIADP
ncbi:MAG: hypothetical protein OEM29_09255, partial [Thermoplasmata archaeon]|nr:hypothetical protein [Thermoplasmata archaeon]